MSAAINDAMKKYIVFCLQFTVYPEQLWPHTFGVIQVDLELMILQTVSQALGCSDNRCVPPHLA